MVESTGAQGEAMVSKESGMRRQEIWGVDVWRVGGESKWRLFATRRPRVERFGTLFFFFFLNVTLWDVSRVRLLRQVSVALSTWTRDLTHSHPECPHTTIWFYPLSFLCMLLGISNKQIWVKIGYCHTSTKSSFKNKFWLKYGCKMGEGWRYTWFPHILEEKCIQSTRFLSIFVKLFLKQFRS